jgi:putative aminopeptidase FrvX
MPVKASSHVHGDDAKNEKRNADTLEVRLDAMVSSAEDVEALGVQVGDFVYVDPRVELTDGFIRSRFLDDKACVACMVGAMQALHQAGLAPAQRTTFHFSTYEEVGHGGAAGFPPDIVELLTLDMAAIGEGQSSDEFHTTICVKDSGGPYHLGFRRRLIGLAKKHEIPYKLDIYTYYASDGEALWHAGADVEVGLLGPGIDGSHSYERTHEDSLKSTTELLVAYLLSE